LPVFGITDKHNKDGRIENGEKKWSPGANLQKLRQFALMTWRSRSKFTFVEYEFLLSKFVDCE